MVFTDKLTKSGILKELNISNDFTLEVFDSIDSTNLYLKEKAKNGECDYIAVSNSQTKGKGRFDRVFYSPENCGIYMSILTKPRLKAEQSVLMTAAVSVAVCEAVFSLTKQKPSIKWVNDLILGNKKICGILCEGAINPDTRCFDFAVLGIGINVYRPENNFNDEIKDIAGCVLEKKIPNFRNRITAEIINRVFYYLENLENKEFLEKYREFSCVLQKEITVMKENPIKALALDIDDNCRLKVKYPDGKIEYLSSGEISIKL